MLGLPRNWNMLVALYCISIPRHRGTLAPRGWWDSAWSILVWVLLPTLVSIFHPCDLLSCFPPRQASRSGWSCSQPWGGGRGGIGHSKPKYNPPSGETLTGHQQEFCPMGWNSDRIGEKSHIRFWTRKFDFPSFPNVKTSFNFIFGGVSPLVFEPFFLFFSEFFFKRSQICILGDFRTLCGPAFGTGTKNRPSFLSVFFLHPHHPNFSNPLLNFWIAADRPKGLFILVSQDRLQDCWNSERMSKKEKPQRGAVANSIWVKMLSPSRLISKK